MKGFDIKQFFSVYGVMLHTVPKQAKAMALLEQLYHCFSANVQDTTIVEIKALTFT